MISIIKVLLSKIVEIFSDIDFAIGVLVTHMKEGVLGGIIGASDENFKIAEPYFNFFCKEYFHFGPVGMGAKSKLLNNFLSLGNAALVNHLAKSATEKSVLPVPLIKRVSPENK